MMVGEKDGSKTDEIVIIAWDGNKEEELSWVTMVSLDYHGSWKLPDVIKMTLDAYTAFLKEHIEFCL